MEMRSRIAFHSCKLQLQSRGGGEGPAECDHSENTPCGGLSAVQETDRPGVLPRQTAPVHSFPQAKGKRWHQKVERVSTFYPVSQVEY